MIISRLGLGQPSVVRRHTSFRFNSLLVAMLLAAAGNSSAWAQTGSSLTVDEANAVVAEHNRLRREAGGAVPLAWDNRLAESAQAWAEHLAMTDPLAVDSEGERKLSTDEVSHSGIVGLGENVAWYWSDDPEFVSSAIDALGYWEAVEKPLYDGLPLNPATKVRFWHYTQIIWDRTTLVGCGRARSGSNVDYYVYHYQRPGNIDGELPVTMTITRPLGVGGGDFYAPAMTVANQTHETLKYKFYVPAAAEGWFPAHWTETFSLAAGASSEHHLSPGSTLYAVEAFGEPINLSVAVQSGRTHHALQSATQSMERGFVYWMSWSMQ